MAAAEKLATLLPQAVALESALAVGVSDVAAVLLAHELALREAVALNTELRESLEELVEERDAEAHLDADGDAVGDLESEAVPLAETVTDDDVERRGDGELHADAEREGVAVDVALCDVSEELLGRGVEAHGCGQACSIAPTQAR